MKRSSSTLRLELTIYIEFLSLGLTDREEGDLRVDLSASCSYTVVYCSVSYETNTSLFLRNWDTKRYRSYFEDFSRVSQN
jgi:hypothetical protein